MDQSVVTNPLADGLFKKLLCSKNVLTELVGYQQPSCLRLKMEFVFGTSSLSCNCFHIRSAVFVRVVPAIVYGKWCFVLHV